MKYSFIYFLLCTIIFQSTAMERYKPEYKRAADLSIKSKSKRARRDKSDRSICSDPHTHQTHYTAFVDKMVLFLCETAKLEALDTSFKKLSIEQDADREEKESGELKEDIVTQEASTAEELADFLQDFDISDTKKAHSREGTS